MQLSGLDADEPAEMPATPTLGSKTPAGKLSAADVGVINGRGSYLVELPYVKLAPGPNR